LRALVTEPDERLLIEAAQRDPRHFAQLYESHFDRVYAFIACRVRDRTAAEDLTAEVFHQALAKLDQFEWRGLPFKAWLLRIASNAVHDRWRETGRHRESSSDGFAEPGGDDGTERRTMLVQLLDGLPVNQRLVLTRRFLEDRSTAEIARELDLSEGAIKQLQFRALQTLRSHFLTPARKSDEND
jgi:RNA polymerase sigma-70 factor (ECF subfamily)